MKKSILIGLVVGLCLFMASCSSNEPCRFHKLTVDFTVPQSSWAFDPQNGWYNYYYQTSAITASIYDFGTWTMSHEYNPGTSDAFLIQLPEFKFLQDGNVYYSQRIDYEVGVGYVRVYVTNSGYTYPSDWQPEAMSFHMQITY